MTSKPGESSADTHWDASSIHHALVSVVPHAVFVRDSQGTLEYCNPALAELVGLNVDEIIGYGPGLHEDDPRYETLRGLLKGIDALAESAQGVRAGQVSLSRPGDRTRQLQIHRSTVQGGPQGQPGQMVLLVDVTRQMRTDQALGTSQARMRAILDNASIGIGVLNPQGRYIEANRTWLRMIGYSAEELRGLPVSEITFPDDRAATDENLTALLEGRIRQYHMEKRYLRRDGSHFWAALSVTAIPSENQRPEAVVGIIEDITHRKTVEAELRSKQEDLRTILDSIGDAVLATDRLGRIARMNPVAAELTGWVPEQALGKGIHQVCRLVDSETGEPVDLPVDEVLRTGLRTGLPGPSSLIRPDGTRRDVADHATAIRDETGQVTGVVLVLRDVTEQRQLEDQLRQAQRLESVGRLAGGVAHDFNNQLTVIKGYADLMIRDFQPGSPEHEGLQEILSASNRAHSLTRQLLAFGRKQVLRPERLDLGEVVTELHSVVSRMIGVEVTLNVMGQGQGRLFARVDRGQLQQALINLVVNARDAMPDGGAISLEVMEHTLEEAQAGVGEAIRPGRYVVLAVSDEGEGIPVDIQDQVFEPFFTTRDFGKGTGLGLSMVYGFVKQSGGMLQLRSKPGQGSTFRIFLPAMAPEGQGESPGRWASERSERGGASSPDARAKGERANS